MDVGLLEQIVKMMATNDLNAVELRDGEKRISLHRGAAAHTGPIYHTVAPAHAPAAPAAPAPAVEAVDEDAGLKPIKSPMVGTFYAAGSPEAKPFVQVGSTIDEETDVCIIEAMKVFNNIKAETRGTITKILVTNGQTVEFGQILFLVKP
jgi:acetyl-CoA carboxylase biotin carboxyl carrier protein